MSDDTPVEVKEKSYNKDLGSKDKEIVADLVMKANNHLKKSAMEVIEFGKILIELKERLPGTFTFCVKEEFEMSHMTATGYMNVAKTFGNLDPESKTGKIILSLSPTVLVNLASPSMPSEAISEVFGLVEGGNKVTVETVKKLKDGKPVIVSNDSKSNSLFDDPDEADRKDVALIESRLKEKMETIIKEVDKVTEDLYKLYRKIPDKNAFFERGKLFFEIKKRSEDSIRVLKSLENPEKFREFFIAKIAELSS